MKFKEFNLKEKKINNDTYISIHREIFDFTKGDTVIIHIDKGAEFKNIFGLECNFDIKKH